MADFKKEMHKNNEISRSKKISGVVLGIAAVAGVATLGHGGNVLSAFAGQNDLSRWQAENENNNAQCHIDFKDGYMIVNNAEHDGKKTSTLFEYGADGVEIVNELNHIGVDTLDAAVFLNNETAAYVCNEIYISDVVISSKGLLDSDFKDLKNNLSEVGITVHDENSMNLNGLIIVQGDQNIELCYGENSFLIAGNENSVHVQEAVQNCRFAVISDQTRMADQQILKHDFGTDCVFNASQCELTAEVNTYGCELSSDGKTVEIAEKETELEYELE